MSEDQVSFDPVWTPKRYPSNDEPGAAATWRLVDDAIAGRVGIVWLSDNSTGVRWITQTDGINSLVATFSSMASDGESMSSAYMSAVRTKEGVIFSPETTGVMADVDSAFKQIMDSVVPVEDATTEE